MNIVTRKPFEREASLEDIYYFDYHDRTTRTRCSLLNRVLEAMYELKNPTHTNIAAYLGLHPTRMSNALDVLTGFTFLEIREIQLRARADKVVAEHPDWSTDAIARAVGLKDRSGLRNLYNRELARKYSQRRKLKGYSQWEHTPRPIIDYSKIPSRKKNDNETLAEE